MVIPDMGIWSTQGIKETQISNIEKLRDFTF